MLNYKLNRWHTIKRNEPRVLTHGSTILIISSSLSIMFRLPMVDGCQVPWTLGISLGAVCRLRSSRVDGARCLQDRYGLTSGGTYAASRRSNGAMKPIEMTWLPKRRYYLMLLLTVSMTGSVMQMPQKTPYRGNAGHQEAQNLKKVNESKGYWSGVDESSLTAQSA